jgi:hypothetical protein
MERAVPSNKDNQGQPAAASGARRGVDNAPAADSCRLGRIAANINSSPRVQRLVQLNEDIQRSTRVQGLRQLAEQAQPAVGPVNSGISDRQIVQKKRDPGNEQTQTDFHNSPRGDNEKETDTVATAVQNYEASLKRGTELVHRGLNWFVGASSIPPISTEETHKKVIDAGYKIFWFFPDEESVTICMIRGKEYDGLKSEEVGGYFRENFFVDDQDYFYANTFNVKTGEFSASINYRNKDQEIADKEELPAALSNSEIIWFQQAFARAMYGKKHGEETGPLAKINSISREEIGNTQTLDTIFMCDDERVAFQGGTKVISEPTEEAMALLGTPNGNSSVWILIQHETPGGSVDIESVEFTEDGLVIRFLRR